MFGNKKSLLGFIFSLKYAIDQYINPTFLFAEVTLQLLF